MPQGTPVFAPSGFAPDGIVYAADVLPYFAFTTFTVTATSGTDYTLPELPVHASCLLAINGDVKQEGVGYTVDDSTGVISISAPLGVGDVIIARWESAAHLVV